MCETVKEIKCPFCKLTEHCVSSAKKFKSSETGKHLHNSLKELLLATRAFVDEAICRKRQKSGNPLQKVPVD